MSSLQEVQKIPSRLKNSIFQSLIHSYFLRSCCFSATNQHYRRTSPPLNNCFASSTDWIMRTASSAERCFELLQFQVLEPKVNAIALSVDYFHLVTVAIQKNIKHGIDTATLVPCQSTASKPSMDFLNFTGLRQMWTFCI